MTRNSVLIAVAAVVATATAARAENADGGPELWRVTGVAADDMLNARMGPAIDFPVIETFAPDERGLELITCVPFHAITHAADMNDAEKAVLPPPWCLMRDADGQRAGWVAQRFITWDDNASRIREATGPSGEGDPIDTLSARFLDGYAPQDTLQVFDQILAALDPVDPQPSVFFASARIEPLTMAVLALETAEGQRDRVRYRITYGIEGIPNPPKHSPLPLSFIQVDRFSLGSAIRQEAIDSHGAEHVAPPEEFDAGPHVSWRLITRPVQGTTADIVAAGRTEISDAQAQKMTCLNNPCLSSGMDVQDAASWGAEEKMTPNPEPVPFQVRRDGLLTPAAAIDDLTRERNFDEQGQQRENPNLPDPFFEAVIEINLAQDSMLDAAMRMGGLKDDSIAAVWRRLVVIPSAENVRIPQRYRAEAYECHGGLKFPPEGRFCQ